VRDGVKKGKTIKKYADLFLISLIILSVFFADYSFANFDNYRETSKRQAAESRFQTFLFDL